MGKRIIGKLVLAGALAVSLSACGSEEGKDYSNVELGINEVEPKNQTSFMDEDGSYPDWVEIYNAGSEAVDLEGFIFGDAKSKHTLPAGVGQIKSKGVKLFIADDHAENGPNHLPLKFASDGDSVSISDPTGKLLDSFDIPSVTEEGSYARYPDGTGEFVFCIYPTPEAPNGDACAASTAAP